MFSFQTNPSGSSGVFEAIGFILSLILTAPVWLWLWNEWFGNDYYSHGVLIVPISFYLGFRKVKIEAKKLEKKETASYKNWGGIILFCGAFIYLYFIDRLAYHWAAFSMLIIFGGLIWSFFGLNFFKALFFPLFFMVFMIPLPFIDRVTLPLAKFTGACSGFVTRILGLNIEIIGQSVKLPNADLVIGAQCSGINSIISLFTLSILLVYALNASIWKKMLLPVLAILLAMFSNILRVASLIIYASVSGVEQAFTFYHDYSGFLAFGLVLILLVQILKLLKCTTFNYEVL